MGTNASFGKTVEYLKIYLLLPKDFLVLIKLVCKKLYHIWLDTGLSSNILNQRKKNYSRTQIEYLEDKVLLSNKIIVY